VNIYDKIYATDNSYNASVEYKLEMVLQWVKNNGFKNLLDVGCGQGHYLKLLSENGIKVTGLEPSKNIADTLKDYDVINDDILGLAKKKRQWEALICMDVLEHIEPSEIEETVKALSSLAPHALIGIANHSDIWRGVQLHLIQQGPYWWRDLLSHHYSRLNCIHETFTKYRSKQFFIYEAVR
jgi:2-polyprenyl-3-methyl-5-hydroxy-6-metoxy-1,4-benzoquinol methylase